MLGNVINGLKAVNGDWRLHMRKCFDKDNWYCYSFLSIWNFRLIFVDEGDY